MKTVVIAAALASLTLGSSAARAAVTVFNASGTFADGSTLGGSINVDTTAGTVVSSALTLSAAPGAIFSVIDSQGYSSTDGNYLFFETSGSAPQQLRLGTLTTTLVGYNGGALNSLAALSTNDYYSDYHTATGSIVALNVGALSAVPEPATWALMIGGFALVGTSMRSRKATHSRVVATN